MRRTHQLRQKLRQLQGISYAILTLSFRLQMSPASFQQVSNKFLQHGFYSIYELINRELRDASNPLDSNLKSFCNAAPCESPTFQLYSPTLQPLPPQLILRSKHIVLLNVIVYVTFFENLCILL